MKRWIEGLTRLPLAEEGIVLSDDERSSLTDEMTEALKVDLPVLKFLRASELVTAEVSWEKKLWLVFQLAERASLLVSREALRRCFLEEVETARSQLESVEWRIREAMAEGRAPGDGIIDGPEDASTRAIRERVKRNSRNGQLLIPGVPICRWIEVGPLPATLSRGPKIKISARVDSMTRTQAKRRNVVVASADMRRAMTIPRLAKCNVLDRDLRDRHFEIGEALRQAMDAESRIDLSVKVVLDWASGIALRFQTHS